LRQREGSENWEDWHVYLSRFEDSGDPDDPFQCEVITGSIGPKTEPLADFFQYESQYIRDIEPYAFPFELALR
jgi:hypothetical protein